MDENIIETEETDIIDEDLDNEGNVDLDEIADVAIDTIQGILSYFDIGEVTIDEYEGDEGCLEWSR